MYVYMYVYTCVFCVCLCVHCVCVCVHVKRESLVRVFSWGFLTLIDYNNIQTLCEVFYNTYLVFPKIIFPSLDS